MRHPRLTILALLLAPLLAAGQDLFEKPEDQVLKGTNYPVMQYVAAIMGGGLAISAALRPSRRGWA